MRTTSLESSKDRHKTVCRLRDAFQVIVLLRAAIGSIFVPVIFDNADHLIGHDLSPVTSLCPECGLVPLDSEPGLPPVDGRLHDPIVRASS